MLQFRRSKPARTNRVCISIGCQLNQIFTFWLKMNGKILIIDPNLLPFTFRSRCKFITDLYHYVNWQGFFYPPSSGIASCVETAGAVTWCLHLTRPCCVALGWGLIWVVCPDWFEELCDLGFLIPKTNLLGWQCCLNVSTSTFLQWIWEMYF